MTVIRADIDRSRGPLTIASMVPNRTLPIAGNPRILPIRRRSTTDLRQRSILQRLASLIGARRTVPDPKEVADLVLLDRALDLIEHQTCDCL
jgi:hypothetical protein